MAPSHRLGRPLQRSGGQEHGSRTQLAAVLRTWRSWPQLLPDARSRGRLRGQHLRGVQYRRFGQLPCRSLRQPGCGYELVVTSERFRDAQYLDLQIDPSSANTLFFHSGLPDPGRPATVRVSTLRRSRRCGAPLDGDRPGAHRNHRNHIRHGVALDSRTPGRLFAAAVVTKFGLWRPYCTPVFDPADRGTTWTSSARHTGHFHGFLVDPFQASSIYGSAPGGVLAARTRAGRSSFRAQFRPFRSPRIPLLSGRLYAASPANGVLMSSEPGERAGRRSTPDLPTSRSRLLH